MTEQKTEITGRLEGWRYDQHNHVLWGDVYDDTRNRWSDGVGIHTSWLKINAVDAGKLKEGDVVATRNSTYLLGKKQEARPPVVMSDGDRTGYGVND